MKIQRGGSTLIPTVTLGVAHDFKADRGVLVGFDWLEANSPRTVAEVAAAAAVHWAAVLLAVITYPFSSEARLGSAPAELRSSPCMSAHGVRLRADEAPSAVDVAINAEAVRPAA